MSKFLDKEEIFWESSSGKIYCDRESALAALLTAEVCFLNERQYIEYTGEPSGHTTLVYVNSSDLFMWGCADGDDLPLEQIEVLYKMWKLEGSLGADKWCCIQRNQQPQPPMVTLMKKEGVWDETMEKLEPNWEDAAKDSWLRENAGRILDSIKDTKDTGMGKKDE